jgi:hypothetical protein
MMQLSHGRQAGELPAAHLIKVEQAAPRNLLHQLLKDDDALAQPGEFLAADLVLRRVARVDIGVSQQLETAPAETIVARLCSDKARRHLSQGDRRKFSLCDFGL